MPSKMWDEHDDVIKWKHFPRYWPFVRGIHRSPVISPHKGQWRGALMFSLICVWINGWVNNREVGDLRRYRAHHDVTVMNYFSMLESKLTPVIKRGPGCVQSRMNTLTTVTYGGHWKSNRGYYRAFGKKGLQTSGHNVPNYLQLS